MSNGGTPSLNGFSLDAGAARTWWGGERAERGREKRRKISKDKVPCTRMAAVVGTQRDRVAWLLFISSGSWLEYILPRRACIPALLSLHSPPFSGASSFWRSREEWRRARTGSANLADFFLWQKWRLNEFLTLRNLGGTFVTRSAFEIPYYRNRMNLKRNNHVNRNRNLYIYFGSLKLE